MSILSIKNLSIGTNVAQPDYARLLSAGFARTARDFGIEFNPHFPDFVCAMGFTNGVLFQSWHPDEVARLTGKLESSPSLPSLELPQAAASLAEAFPGGPVDSGDLQRVLARLVYIGIETPKCDDELPGPLGRAILLGLRLAALQPAQPTGLLMSSQQSPGCRQRAGKNSEGKGT